MDRTETHFTLADGRRLAYRDDGDPRQAPGALDRPAGHWLAAPPVSQGPGQGLREAVRPRPPRLRPLGPGRAGGHGVPAGSRVGVDPPGVQAAGRRGAVDVRPALGRGRNRDHHAHPALVRRRRHPDSAPDGPLPGSVDPRRPAHRLPGRGPHGRLHPLGRNHCRAGRRLVAQAVEPRAGGLLDVGDGQRLFWEESGNPDGRAVVALHGGPGSGSTAGLRHFFDPALYRIVLFDQRGCGRSVPHASDPAVPMAGNTTADLLEDIERLRVHLGIGRWVVFGLSWGTVLGLAYAERHPERVAGLVLSGVAVRRRDAIDWLYWSWLDRL